MFLIGLKLLSMLNTKSTLRILTQHFIKIVAYFMLCRASAYVKE